MSRLWVALHGFDGYDPPLTLLHHIQDFLAEWDSGTFKSFTHPGLTITEENAVETDTRHTAGYFRYSLGLSNVCLY